MVEKLIDLYNLILARVRALDFLAPLALRLYLFPVFWMAGTNKLSNPEGVIAWFEHGLKLPLPTLMFWLAALTEAGGAILLLLGLATPIIAVPLIITMLVAAFAVHWDDGWLAIASSSPSIFTSEEEAMAVSERLDRAKSILQEHGNYDWLTEKGSFVILNNGIEMAITYLFMLLVLLFYGGGRYVSADYWIGQVLGNNKP